MILCLIEISCSAQWTHLLPWEQSVPGSSSPWAWRSPAWVLQRSCWQSGCARVLREIQGLQVLHDLEMWDMQGKQAAQGSVLEWGIEAAVRHSFSAFWTSQNTIAKPFVSLCVSIDCNINFCPLLPPDIDFPPRALWPSSPFWQQGRISVSVFIQCPAWRETDFCWTFSC